MFNIIFYSVSEISQLSSGLSGLITWICTRRIGHSKDNFASRFSDAYRVKRVSSIIWTEPPWTDIGDRNKINESYLTSTFNVLAVAVKIKLFFWLCHWSLLQIHKDMYESGTCVSLYRPPFSGHEVSGSKHIS